MWPLQQPTSAVLVFGMTASNNPVVPLLATCCFAQARLGKSAGILRHALLLAAGQQARAAGVDVQVQPIYALIRAEGLATKKAVNTQLRHNMLP